MSFIERSLSAQPVQVFDDRSMRVPPGRIVKTAWVSVDVCRLLCKDRMSPEAVFQKYQKLLHNGDDGCWPPPRGEWESDVFNIIDGRHEYIATLMLGREEIFVAWLADIAP